MADFPAADLLAEGERLAKEDGYISLMAMPKDRRTQYARAAKAVLTERERAATVADEFHGHVIAAHIREGHQ